MFTIYKRNRGVASFSTSCNCRPGWLSFPQPRSQSSWAISDVTQPVKLATRIALTGLGTRLAFWEVAYGRFDCIFFFFCILFIYFLFTGIVQTTYRPKHTNITKFTTTTLITKKKKKKKRRAVDISFPSPTEMCVCWKLRYISFALLVYWIS